MNVALRKPRMTREQFLDWVQAGDARHEFDGFQPVAMGGVTRAPSQICQNIYTALRSRLRGRGCDVLGPDAGVATIGDAVRYPDALVTCTKGPGTDRLIPGVITVFEVLSPNSGRVDRIDKVREYAAVASIRRYLIVESTSAGLTVFSRAGAGDAWAATALTGDDTLRLDELGIEVPVSEFYVDIAFPEADRAPDQR